MIKKHSFAFVIFTAAVVLRILFIFYQGIHLTSDELDYYNLAMNIVHGNGFSVENGLPTAYRPPAYPYFLSVLFTLHNSVYFIEIMQAVIESISGLLLFIIGKKIFSERAGLTAMIVWSLFPSSIIMPSQLLSETLYVFLLLIFVVSTIHDKSNKIFPAVGIGIISGALILLKPQTILVLIILALYAIMKRKDYSRIKTGMFVTLGILLIIAPWIIRNKIIFDEYLITTNGGINFWIGNNSEANGSYKIPSIDPLSSIDNEAKRNSEGYRLGVNFIHRHFVKWVELGFLKTAYLFSSQNYLSFLISNDSLPSLSYKENLRMMPWQHAIGLNIPYLIIITIGTMGFIITLKHYASVFPFHMLLAAWIAIHVLYFGSARFNYPMLPFFCLMGSAVIAGRSFFEGSNKKNRIYAVACAVIITLPTLAEFIVAYI